MNLHAMRIFHAVAEAGSVTQAAAALLLSQPAVTAQLRNLERELGLALLQPHGRGIALTDAGAKLAEQAKRLFRLERAIEEEMAALRLGRGGRLRIAATSLPARALLPGWLAGFKREHDGVEIELATGNAAFARQALLRYEADVALIGGGGGGREGAGELGGSEGVQAHDGIRQEWLLEDEFWFVVPGGHPLAGKQASLERLADEPFLVREPGSRARERLMALFIGRGLRQPRVGLQLSGWPETAQALKSGYGAAFASALEVREEVERGQLGRVIVPEVRAVNAIYLCTRTDDEPAPVAQAFAAWVRAALNGAGR
ncbi:MAG: LysR family transcriptional regulator [Paenibacillaceae bacterium]|nr:LysR family transcriptional regulator [Paenibacillaceae bacterium]